MFVLLAMSRETPQQAADRALAEWQVQRKAGVPAEKRQIPDDAFSRDLEIIRQVMERS